MAKPAADPFDVLFNNSAEPVATQKTAPKKKFSLDLTPEEEALFNSVCAADGIAKMATKQHAHKRDAVLPVLKKKFLLKCMEYETKIGNPTIQTSEAQGNFIVTEGKSFVLPERDDETTVPLEEVIKAKEVFDDEEVKTIAKEYFTQEKVMDFQSISAIRKGKDEVKKAVVHKLLRLVSKNFTPKEQKMLLKSETRVVAADKYISKAVEFADGDYAKLSAMISLVEPEWRLSHLTYTGADIKKTVANLVGGEENLTAGEEKSEKFYDPAGKWQAEVDGDNAVLYEVDETGVPLKVLTKPCAHAAHARATCAKWLKDEAYRTKCLN